MAMAIKVVTLYTHGCVHPKDNSKIVAQQIGNGRSIQHPPLAHAASMKPTKSTYTQKSEVKRAIALTSERAFALIWGFPELMEMLRNPPNAPGL